MLQWTLETKKGKEFLHYLNLKSNKFQAHHLVQVFQHNKDKE